MKLWVRAGDGDDYHDFDGYQEVADYLGPLGVGTVERYGQYGVTGDGFHGPYNYISLYWGEDKEPEPERELTDQEITQVNNALDYYFRTGAHA